MKIKNILFIFLLINNLLFAQFEELFVDNINLNLKRALCPNGLTQVPGSPFASNGLQPRGIDYSPNGNFLIVSNSFNNSVSIFSVNQSTGALTLIQTLVDPIMAGPSGLKFYPNGNFVAVSTFNNIDSVVILSVSPTGNIAVVQSVSVLVGTPPTVDISPDGKFAATPNLGANTASFFTVDQNTGFFTLVGSTATQNGPFDVAYFPNGQFAAVVNRDSNSVTVYSVSQINGALTPINGTVAASSFATQLFPRSISFSPNGEFAAITNRDSNTVTIYSVNQTTGVFTPVTGDINTSSFATQNTPNGVEYSPDGSYLVVANEFVKSGGGGGPTGPGTISVYNVETNGLLTLNSVYPLNQLAPNSVSISPNSNFVAITNSRSNSISVFSTNIAASPVTGSGICNQPINIEVTGCGSSLTISSVSSPANGTATFSGTTITYTSNANFSGTDTFTYTLSDGTGKTASSTVTVTVTCSTPTPPIINASAIVRAIINKYCPLLRI